MSKPRDKHDWELIEREYRAGQLSVREVAKKYKLSEGAIRRHAKLCGLTRDLTEKVQRAVRIKLVSTKPKPEACVQSVSDDEIVDAAADRAVAVVEIQRSDINKLRSLELDLIRRVEEDEKIAIIYQGQVTAQLSVGLPARAEILQKLAFVSHKRIQLERQAYGLESGYEESTGVTVIIKRQGDRDTDQASPMVSSTGLELP